MAGLLWRWPAIAFAAHNTCQKESPAKHSYKRKKSALELRFFLPRHFSRWCLYWKALIFRILGSCLKTGQHSIFLTIHLFLPIKYIFLFRIKDTASDHLSVLLNFIANYDSKNENIAPYCIKSSINKVSNIRILFFLFSL